MDHSKLAKIYDQYYSPKWPVDNNIEALINYLKKWPGGDNIIELGVGTGNVAGKLYLEGYHNITGVDICSEMLDQAKLKFPKIKFIHDNFCNANFKSFDWVIIVGMIFTGISNHDKKLLLEKMYEELPNDSLIFINFRNWNYHPNFRNESLVEREYDNIGTYKIFDYYKWLDYNHCKGKFEYINIQNDEIFEAKYEMWILTEKDLSELVIDTGFKIMTIATPQEIGYSERFNNINIWVLKK